MSIGKGCKKLIQFFTGHIINSKDFEVFNSFGFGFNHIRFKGTIYILTIRKNHQEFASEFERSTAR